MKTKITNKQKESGIGVLALAIIGGIVALVVGIGMGLAVYALISLLWTEPKPQPVIVPPAGPNEEEMFAPMCDCGGICVVD